MVIGHNVLIEFNRQKYRFLDFQEAYKEDSEMPVIRGLLDDYGMFKNVKIEGNTLEWPNGFDVDPEQLFEDSYRLDASYFNNLKEQNK